MSEVIDRKFQILAVNPCKQGAVYTEEDGIFFCAKDKALLPTLEAYRYTCKQLGCAEEHLESIGLLMDRVADYQKTNSKLPDTDTDCEIDRCIGGIGV